MWMKIDDQLHHHRKTRKVTKSHAEKRRDAAPMGLWVLAGAWAGQNNTGGWVPEEQLETWDDAWEALAARLVDAGYWWAEDRDGDPGYGFNDWFEWNTASATAAAAGRYGNHKKWHVDRGIVSPDCDLCPQEPQSDDPPDHPDSGPIATRSDAVSGRVAPDEPDEIADLASRSEHDRTRSGGLADPVPVPEPEPENPSASADAERGGGALSPAKQIEADFAEWYALYPLKKDKGHALKAYRAARRKKGVTREVLLDALRQQLPELQGREPKKRPFPGTWLNGERWEDEDESADASAGSGYAPQYPHASEFEPAPSGMTPEEAVAWSYEQAAKRKRNRAGGEA